METLKWYKSKRKVDDALTTVSYTHLDVYKRQVKQKLAPIVVKLAGLLAALPGFISFTSEIKLLLAGSKAYNSKSVEDEYEKYSLLF